MTQPRLLDPAAPDVATLAEQLAQAIAALPDLPAQVEALNRARRALHAVSPLRHHPVDLVEWVPAAEVHANSYNPNSVAPPEMRALERSIARDGYTMPVYTWPGEGQREVIDGAHRTRVALERPRVRRATHGYLPVTTSREDRRDLASRIEATVLHNEARGAHSVDGTQALVEQLLAQGVPAEEVARSLNMDADELLRYRVRGGLLDRFRDGEYSEAWK